MTRVLDGKRLECGVSKFAPGEILNARLSDPKDGTYAEHVFELDSWSGAKFTKHAGCDGRRAAGQWQDKSTEPPFTVDIQSPSDGSTLTIGAGWQRSFGAVRIPKPCVLASTSGDPTNKPPRPTKKPVADPKAPSAAPHASDL